MDLQLGTTLLPIPPIGPLLYVGLPVLIEVLWIWRDVNRREKPGWL